MVGAAGAAFSAGAGLALLDHILRAEPPFAGALRQRLALRAAAACASALRLREDEAALRDAEHLASGAGETSPAGRVHRLWRAVGGRRATLDAAAAALVDRPPDLDWAEVAGALHGAFAGRAQPLAVAATAGVVLARELPATLAPKRKSSPGGRPMSRSPIAWDGSGRSRSSP